MPPTDHSAVGAAGNFFLPPLHLKPPCQAAIVKLEPRSRRRPLSSTWAGAPWEIVFTKLPMTSAGPCDVASDTLDVPKTVSGVDYFFAFRRFVFFGAFFAAAFVFLFFAIAALLA